MTVGLPDTAVRESSEKGQGCAPPPPSPSFPCHVKVGLDLSSIDPVHVSTPIPRFLFIQPTVTQNVYVDPFPEDLRQAGERFKIDLVQESAKMPQTGVFPDDSPPA